MYYPAYGQATTVVSGGTLPLDLLVKIIPHRKYLHLSALLFFVVAMMLIQWPVIFENIYGHGFTDRNTYKNYFLNGESVLIYKKFEGVVAYITDEFLWHYLIGTAATSLGISIELVFHVITITCLCVFGAIIISKRRPLALLLLINPLVIDFAFSQLRLALAISILGAAYVLKTRYRLITLIFVICSLFIHTASMIFIIIYVALRVVDSLANQLNYGYWVRFALLCLIGFSISIAIGPLREAMLSAIGDRRADYPDMSSTLAYSSFWVFLLFAIGSRAKSLMKEEYQQYSVVILSIVTMNIFHGGYSARFLAASFPFLISTVLSFRGVYGLMMLFLFIFYAILQWLYWLRLV
jgi:hypothetical protein